MKVNLLKSLDFTKKQAPQISFPVNGERKFAELKHKTLVPSPDTYFKKESHKASPSDMLLSPNENKLVKGAAYGAPNNSEHTFHGTTTFKGNSSRFDKFKDMDDAKRPGPATYLPKQCDRKKVVTHLKIKSERFPVERYNTDAPGPGSYRLQSDFGVYCPEDTLNRVNSDMLLKVASHKVLYLTEKKNRQSII